MHFDLCAHNWKRCLSLLDEGQLDSATLADSDPQACRFSDRAGDSLRLYLGIQDDLLFFEDLDFKGRDEFMDFGTFLVSDQIDSSLNLSNECSGIGAIVGPEKVVEIARIAEGLNWDAVATAHRRLEDQGVDTERGLEWVGTAVETDIFVDYFRKLADFVVAASDEGRCIVAECPTDTVKKASQQSGTKAGPEIDSLPFSIEERALVDHLTPFAIDPRERSKFSESFVFETLCPVDGEMGDMLVIPDDGIETSLSIRQDISDEALAKYLFPANVPEDLKNYRLVIRQPRKALHESWLDDKTDKVSIRETSVEISRELAISIQRTWAAVLAGTRYPSVIHSGQSFDRYVFRVFILGIGFVAGECLAPESPALKRFVGLGKKLLKIGLSGTQPNPAEEAKLISSLDEVERFWRGC